MIRQATAAVTAIIADWMRIFEPDFLGREINDRLSFSSNAHAGLLAIIAWLLAEPWFGSNVNEEPLEIAVQ
ncbi:MAG: hypothetical protein U0892_12825 [Pirellulales bacterium]